MPERHTVIIVGAGISGLATAWWLHKSGIDVAVLEDGSAVGGTMRTFETNGWLVEKGPNSALETTPLLRKLSAEVGIEQEMIYANDEADNRYILRDGTLHPLPMKLGSFLKSKLWSLSGKLRLLKEPFIDRSTKEETIAEFVTRRLGVEFLDYAINPFVAGVYAGSPDQLSVQAAFPKLYALEKNYGGLIKGQILGGRERRKRAEKAKDRSRLFSYKNGMQSLPAAIGNELGSRVHTNTRVESVAPVSENGTRSGHLIHVTGIENGKRFTLATDAVILAVPSYNASPMIEPLDNTLATSLKNIYYPPVAEVYLGFSTGVIGRPLDGFGFLIPEKEHRKILGTIWSSVLFPGRAPEGHVALTTFVGGSRQPELARLSETELVELVVQELTPIMNLTGRPAFSSVTKWEKAIPQYRIGHLSVMEQIRNFEFYNSGIFLSGNYRGGIAVGDCVINSEQMAERISSYIAITKKTISV